MTNPPLSSFGTLNLFKGPSCSQSGACSEQTESETLRSISKIERADKWTLKQVQGDGVCDG
jgi:hypothetical protein